MTPSSETTPGAAAPSNPLLNTEWTLTRFGAPDQQSEPLNNTKITATFHDNGSVNGSAGCNSYFANYRVEDNRLSINQAGRTEMACEQPIMQQEDAFLAALTTAESYAVAGDTLTIAYEGGEMIFRSLPTAHAATLLETPWLLTTFVEGEIASSTVAGSRVTMRLANGVVRGTAGCNRYSGSFVTEEDRVKISQIISTKMACTATGVMEQESRFLQALEAAETWEIDGQTLILNHSGGELHFTVTEEE